MADKQQTITVNYKFNTTDLERASQLLSRANQASNQFQQAGQKAGQGVSQGFSQATRSIVSMEVELARLKTQLEVSTNPTRTAQLAAQFKELSTQLDAAKKSAFGFKPAMDQATKSTQTLTQQFGGLLSAAKTVFTAGIVREVFNVSMSLAELAGNVEGVERAFNGRFANAPNLLKRLQQATQGTVKDIELMQRTLAATNLGVDAQSLPQLLEFATRRAKETGRSVDDLVDRIVRGIGLKSTRVLDDLGISALRLKEELGGVSLEAASVAEVTQAVGRIAQEELNKMGEATENSATKVAQLNVAWENLRVTVAKKVSSGGVIDFMTESVKLLEEGIKTLSSGASRVGEIHAEMIGDAASTKAALFVESEAYKSLGDNIQGKIDLLKKEIADTEHAVATRRKEVQQTNEAITAAEKKYYAESLIGLQTGKSIQQTEAATKGLKKQAEAQKESLAILATTIPILKQYIEELEKITTDPPPKSGVISRLQEEIELVQEQIKYTNDLTKLTHVVTDAQGNQVQVTGTLIERLSLLQAKLADLQREFSDIDIKPIKIEVKDAADGLLEFESNVKRIEVSLQDLQNNLPDLVPKPADTVAKLDTFWTELGEMWYENWRELVTASVDFQADAINSMLDGELRAIDAQLSQVRSYYQQQQELAGDNQRARNELRVREDREIQRLQKLQFEREKRIRRAQVIIDGAAGAVKAFATAPYIVAIVQAAFIAATTIARLRQIDKEQPGFAKGVIDLQGPGTATSDSIPVRLSKGESVMTTWETKYAGDVLKEVRAKKLDNKVLRELKQGRVPVGFNDGKMLDALGDVKRAIEANRPVDLVQQGGMIYTVKKSADGYLRKQRSKSINV